MVSTTRLVRSPAGIIALLALILGGCNQLTGAIAGNTNEIPHAFPGGCSTFALSPVRCTAIVDALERQAGLTPVQVSEIDLLADPGCPNASGTFVQCFRTMAFIVRARFRTADGRVVEQSQFCGVGGQYTLLCSDHPEIQVSVPTGGYMDVPCTGDVPDTCATQFPKPATSAEALETPIAVPSLTIPIDHVGQYEIVVGTGSLANGILEHSTMTIANLHPTDFLLGDGGVALQITSDAVAGRAFDNYYAHGWQTGMEPFTARIRFDVLSYEPGAALRITEIAVN